MGYYSVKCIYIIRARFMYITDNKKNSYETFILILFKMTIETITKYKNTYFEARFFILSNLVYSYRKNKIQKDCFRNKFNNF